MGRIKIKVKAKGLWTPVLVRQVRCMVHWAYEYHNLTNVCTPLQIKLCGPKEIYGDSMDLGHKIVVRLNYGEEWLSTLFHEMTHVQQYAYGRLVLEEKTALWEGGVINRSKVQYVDEPWEIEARKYETRMEKKFLTFAA